MKLSTLALAGAIALSASASLAQPAPPPGPGPGFSGRDAERPDAAKMAEQHAQRLRTVLQLRPEQEPALRALVDATRPRPEELERRRDDRGDARDLSTPQRLDRMQARLAEHQARFARRADAVKRFYAQLSPAQQRAFDALHDGPGGMHGRGGRHGHGPGGFHGPERGPGGPGAEG
jgi:protein CpxP